MILSNQSHTVRLESERMFPHLVMIIVAHSIVRISSISFAASGRWSVMCVWSYIRLSGVCCSQHVTPKVITSIIFIVYAAQIEGRDRPALIQRLLWLKLCARVIYGNDRATCVRVRERVAGAWVTRQTHFGHIHAFLVCVCVALESCGKCRKKYHHFVPESL